MSVLFSTLTPYVRVLLGDHDLDVPLYDEAQLTAAFKAVLNFGDVEGFEVDVATTGVEPVTGSDEIEGQDLKLLIYKVAKMFAPNLSASYAVRTRAFSESFGGNRDLMLEILEEVYRTEHGDMNG